MTSIDSVLPLICMRCGAALPDTAGDAVNQLRCDACGTIHAHEPAPATIGTSPLKPGEPVLAEWAGRWWRAELLERTATDPERWRVRYLGWSDASAQELARDRIHDFGGGAPVRHWKLALALVGLAILAGTGILLANKGKLVSSQAVTVEHDTALTVGQAVEVERDGAWVAAEVLGLYDDGKVLVRYLDRGPVGDEPVERGRLRLP